MHSEPAKPPLSFSRSTVYLFGLLALAALSMPLFVIVQFNIDLASRNLDNFRSAAATAGTNDLLDPSRHMAWQALHHFVQQVFPYPPAVAWLYAPLAHLSLENAMILNAVCTLTACVAAGIVASKIYALPRWFAVLAVLAWQPAVDSMQSAQNGAFFMLAAFVALYGIVRNRSMLAGIACGLLLLKPSIAIGLIVLLIARRRWKALGVTFAIAAVVYAASAAAAGGNWAWIGTYVQALHGYYASDFARNQVASITLPSLLMRAHVPVLTALLCGAALLMVSIVPLARRSELESVSMAPAIGLACSPHAWGYDAGLVLPALFWMMITLREPWRTTVIAALYVVALFQAPSAIVLGFNPLSIVVVLIPLVWLVRLPLTHRARHLLLAATGQ